MADLVWADVIVVAPELATVAVGLQTMVLGYVNEKVAPAEFGGETSQTFTFARALLAAHYATRAKAGAGGSAGMVVGESEGDASIQYAGVSVSADASPLMSSAYGQSFLALVRSSPARAGFVT